MDFLHALLVALHILGACAIVGGWLATFKHPTVGLWQLIGSITQVVTGLALMGLAEAAGGANHVKLTVKLVIGLVVMVCAIIGYRKVRKGLPVSTGLAHAVGGLGLIDVLVATLWH